MFSDGFQASFLEIFKNTYKSVLFKPDTFYRLVDGIIPRACNGNSAPREKKACSRSLGVIFIAVCKVGRIFCTIKVLSTP